MAYTHPNPAAVEFVRAVRGGAFDKAAAALPMVQGARDETLRRAIADLHAHLHRWAEAADALDGLTTSEARLQRNLYGNFAALKQHRPAAYRAALGALNDATNDCRPHALPGGTYTVARVDGNGRVLPLGTDPVARIAAALGQLKTPIDAGQALAFLSIGDGHVLAAVAANAPTLFLGREQPLYVIEPDAKLLLANLLIHDFTAAIEQPRVMWHVGPQWAATLRLDLLTDRFLVFPQVNVKQGGAAPEIEKTLIELLGELGRLDAVASADLAAHYGPLTAADYARALAGEAGRAPRIMLLTTRFSTVLQHSSRDAEEAFRRLGCLTVLVIEPTPHHGLTRSAMRRTLADFKPDLILQIDHHRFEHGDLFPAGLPFVNWVQDLLPHLMTASAGRQLGPADFVLTPSRQRWVDEFAYPARQCLEFRKLTRVPPRPAARQSDGERVVYVSNWGQTPRQITDELLAGQSGITRAVTNEACARMVRVYTDGGTLPSFGDVRRLLTGVMADLGATADEAFVRQTVNRLADRLNNLLYRQQGLAWAAEACERLGLRLELYGAGWDRSPRFAKYARGTIAYGRPLEDLTRSAGVNLILEPFMCMAHQRLLDALAAGGFCLIRDHPANHSCDARIDLFSRADASIDTTAAMRAALGDVDRVTFDTLLAECDAMDASPSGVIDHVTSVRQLQHGGLFPMRGPVLPLLETVTFGGPAELAQRLTRASRDDVLRRDVAAVQRKCVEERFSYRSGMERVIDFVCGRLNEPVAVQKKAA